MGRDANGGLLHTERTNWLDENGVEDKDERELLHLLFDAAESARDEVRQEQLDALEEERNRNR